MMALEMAGGAAAAAGAAAAVAVVAKELTNANSSEKGKNQHSLTVFCHGDLILHTLTGALSLVYIEGKYVSLSS